MANTVLQNELFELELDFKYSSMYFSSNIFYLDTIHTFSDAQGTKKFNFPAGPNFLKNNFPQNFHLPYGQVEGKIH